jgi:hypothetical protein
MEERVGVVELADQIAIDILRRGRVLLLGGVGAIGLLAKRNVLPGPASAVANAFL